MPIELVIALRFLREGRTQTLLIFAGAASGVGVIVFLTALLAGLQMSLIDKTLGSQAHVVIEPTEDVARRARTDAPDEAVAAVIEPRAQRTRSLPGWQDIARDVRTVPGVRAVTAIAAGPGVAVRGDASLPVRLVGIEPESFSRVIRIDSRTARGRWQVRGGEALIGIRLAERLGVDVGARIRLESVQGRAEVVTIGGIFDLGNRNVNETWCLVPLRSGQTLLGLPGGATEIWTSVLDVFAATAVAERIRDRIDADASSWQELNPDLLSGLKAQSGSGNLISVFVVIAVALGIASVLVVSVVQRQAEIGVMRAFGTRVATVSRVFLIQGVIVGLVGSLLGSAMGAGLARLMMVLAVSDDGAPMFPIELTPELVLGACAVAMGTGLVAAIAPARRAARLDPVTAIRNG